MTTSHTTYIVKYILKVLKQYDVNGPKSTPISNLFHRADPVMHFIHGFNFDMAYNWTWDQHCQLIANICWKIVIYLFRRNNG